MLINKKAIRTLALHAMCVRMPNINGKPKFTRVSKSFYDAVEADVRNLIYSRVKSHPSVGKVIKG